MGGKCISLIYYYRGVDSIHSHRISICSVFLHGIIFKLVFFHFFFSLETWPAAPSFPASFASAGRGWENSATCPRFFMMPQAGVLVAFQQSFSSCPFGWFQEKRRKEEKMRITSKRKITLFSLEYLWSFLSILCLTFH